MAFGGYVSAALPGTRDSGHREVTGGGVRRFGDCLADRVLIESQGWPARAGGRHDRIGVLPGRGSHAGLVFARVDSVGGQWV